MPETKGRPRSKTATVERREASVPRHGTRRASLARNHVALANATKTQVRLSALRPPLFRDGREHRGHHPGAKTRRGNEEGCAVWHREFEACTASGVASQCVQPTPTAGGGAAACVPNAGPSHALAGAGGYPSTRPRPVFFLLFTGAARWTAPSARARDARYTRPGYETPARAACSKTALRSLFSMRSESDRPCASGRRAPVVEATADCRPSACGAIRRSARSRR